MRLLCLAAGLLSFIGMTVLGNFQSDDKMIIIGRVTGYDMLFSDTHRDTTLEWTEDGVIFDNKLYEY